MAYYAPYAPAASYTRALPPAQYVVQPSYTTAQPLRPYTAAPTLISSTTVAPATRLHGSTSFTPNASFGAPQASVVRSVQAAPTSSNEALKKQLADKDAEIQKLKQELAALEAQRDAKHAAEFKKGRAALSEKVQKKVDEWLAQDSNPETRAEIEKLVRTADEKELGSRLLKRIAFGTAGLRGPMKAGFACMNNLTVIQASQGLCMYLEREVPDAKTRGVAIGYDGRHHSKEFAHLSAAAFLSRGHKVYLYSTLVCTPMVPFCVQQKNCAAGVMVTASHNPKNDNGYKVYWGNGCQIIPPHDDGIAKSIDENTAPWNAPISLCETSPLRIDPLVELTQKYLAAIKADHCYHESENRSSKARIVYTAMHGVGAPWVAKAFAAFGLAPYVPVKEQIDPDPEFSTVEFPNPEEGKGALTLAIKTAEANKISVIFANDPDADRLAVAEKQPNGEWRVFSGNELGSILGHWVWKNYIARHPDFDKKRGLMCASTVSSKFLKAMGHKEGFRFEEALTGFKWIGNRAIEVEQKENFKFLFGFEEAIGFMIGDTCWDKDGVRAAAVFAEMYSALFKKNMSLSQQLENLYREYGHFESKVHYFFCYNPETMVKIFDRLRENGNYPKAAGRFPVKYVRDLTTMYDNSQPDNKAVLPKSSFMITFTFENGCVATLRGSGTEPKLKYYVELSGTASPEEVRAELKEMVDAIIADFLEPEKNGLVKPKDA